MIIRPAYIFPFLILFSLIFTFSSCSKKDEVDTSPSLTLSFSSDTIIFDTVFTTVGSVTQRLIVYNRNENKVKISRISLAGGNGSNYKINIDGQPVSSVSDVELPGGDSLFIFIRVTIDPTNQNLPLIVADSLVFTTNGNIQDVKLVAWGQDAHFYQSANLEGSNTWDSLKPHVVYGFVRIDTGASLTILPGTKVYFHKDASMNLSSGATLKILGTVSHPVRFQGDRLDEFYRDLSGQWDGIYLEKGSLGHEINYAILKNGRFGLAADTINNATPPLLNLHNSIIQNMSLYGIYAYASSIVSTNCVIGDCGSASLSINAGGSYDFRQLSIGNYWSGQVRFSPALTINNYTVNDFGVQNPSPLTNAYFGNCIVYGNSDEEMGLDTLASAAFNATFDHCILKTKHATSDPVHYIGCMKNKDPLFVDVQAYDYRIDSLSPAIDQGIQMGVLFDLLGNDRGSTPDLGAYEWMPGR